MKDSIDNKLRHSLLKLAQGLNRNRPFQTSNIINIFWHSNSFLKDSKLDVMIWKAIVQGQLKSKVKVGYD